MVIEFEGTPLDVQTRDGGEVYKARLTQGNFNDKEVYAQLNRQIAEFIAEHPNLAGLIVDASELSKLNMPGLQQVKNVFNDGEVGMEIKKLQQLVVFGVESNSIAITYLNWFFSMVRNMTHFGLSFEVTQEGAEKHFREKK
jgi:hypothetical protein